MSDEKIADAERWRAAYRESEKARLTSLSRRWALASDSRNAERAEAEEWFNQALAQRDEALAQLAAEREGAALVLRLVERQAEDEGLWFRAETAPEAYLQVHLRELHSVIESALAREKGP